VRKSPTENKEGLIVHAKQLTIVFLAAFLTIGLGACSASRQAGKVEPTGSAVTGVPKVDSTSTNAKGAEQKAEQKKETAAAPVPSSREKEAAAVILKDIYFEFDRYLITPDSGETLKQNSNWFKSDRSARMLIEGNCDERGTVEYNLALGQKRADAAKTYLINLGIDGKNIETISYGKEKPVDQGKTPEAWAKNRRDHFVPTR
jgi:peptidoglycan-associated lipoprotein